MDAYGDFLIGSATLPALQQPQLGDSNNRVIRESDIMQNVPCSKADAGKPPRDGYCEGLNNTTHQDSGGDCEEPLYGTFTEMLRHPMNTAYAHLLHEPMGSENRMFMITGRDGRTETPGEQYNDELEGDEEDIDGLDAIDIARDTEETEPVSTNSENVSSLTQQPGYTHRFGKATDPQNPAVVEHLSQDDIETYLQNENMVGSQSSSQEIRSQHFPNLDMLFPNHIDAFAFYNTYASIAGFSVKKVGNYHCRGVPISKTTRYTYKCNRSGKVVSKDILEQRKKIREQNRLKKAGLSHPLQVKKARNKNTIEITGCQAKMVVTLKDDDKWRVTSFEMQHNNPLNPPGEAKYLRSHKHMTEQEKLLIKTLNSVKLPTRKIMAILAGMRGGISAVPYTKKDVSNYRTAIRNESNQNDIMMVLDYFRKRQMEDPRFYYAFKLDEDYKVQNIFWADGHSRTFITCLETASVSIRPTRQTCITSHLHLLLESLAMQITACLLVQSFRMRLCGDIYMVV